MAFLSLLDERARPKGSRDPLGFEMVWTYFGRRVVGNLTTITSSWRVFSVGLLGFHWCQQLCKDAHPDHKQRLLQEHFIRFEQLAGYLRCLANHDDVMGITRVRLRLGSGQNTLSIGVEQQQLILSDQISYGIWGLYSTAMRESGLVSGDGRELTAAGHDIVKWIEGKLNRDWFWQYMRGDKTSLSIEEAKIQAPVFAQAITQHRVKSGLVNTLLKGSKHECQLALYRTIPTLPEEVLSNWSLWRFIAGVREYTASAVLKDALDDIDQLEQLLVVANTLFDYCRLKDGVLLVDVAATVKQIYDNFSFLPERPELNDCPYGEDLKHLHSLLKKGQIQEALRSLLQLNKKIMDGRGGAAWVELAGDGTLRVRMRSETAQLKSIEELKIRYDYDYFLRSYARIALMSRD